MYRNEDSRCIDGARYGVCVKNKSGAETDRHADTTKETLVVYCVSALQDRISLSNSGINHAKRQGKRQTKQEKSMC